MNYVSTVEFESERIPGLKYKLRKMSSGRRADFRIKTADIISEIELKRVPLQTMLDERKESTDEAEKATLEDKILILQTSIWNEVIVAKLYPALIRWGVEEVSGIEVDGQPITIDLLFNMPEEIITEAGSKIDSILNMTFEQQTLFKQPSISSAPMDGQTPDSSAQTAG